MLGFPVVLPSGLAGEVRKLKIRETKMLADIGQAKKVSTYNAIYDAVWLKTKDASIYTFDGGSTPPWGKVLLGDRLTLFIQVWGLSSDWTFDFDLQCGGKLCREQFGWSLDLRTLPVKELPEASKEIIRAGGLFETEVDGMVVTFRLATGEDEDALSKLRKKHAGEMWLAGLANQIVSISGLVTPQGIQIEKPSFHRKMAWLEDLDQDQGLDLLAQFQEVDCGTETTIEVACPHCGLIQKVEVPFDAMPTTKKRRSQTSDQETFTES